MASACRPYPQDGDSYTQEEIIADYPMLNRL